MVIVIIIAYSISGWKFLLLRKGEAAASLRDIEAELDILIAQPGGLEINRLREMKSWITSLNIDGSFLVYNRSLYEDIISKILEYIK